MARELALAPATAVLALDDTAALALALARVDVIVQATPVGRQGDAHALPWGHATHALVAFEMLYRPRVTPFVQQAQSAGHEIVFGWEMLLSQGLASFALWCAEPVPRDEMRAALLHALPA